MSSNQNQSMGILKLLPFIRDTCTRGYYSGKYLYHYAGKTMGVDAHVHLHEFISGGTSIAEGFIRLAMLLKGSGINPLFVFDGKAGETKAITTEKRAADRRCKAQHLATVMETPELFSPDEIEKAEKGARVITHEHILLAQRTLEILSIPHVASSGEADLVLADLFRSGKIQGVFSKDSDMIVHNISPLVIGLVGYQTGPLEEYRSEEIRTELGLSSEEFVDFCILCGCDYTEKIKQVGPAKAYKFIREYKNIENLLTHLPKLGKQYQVPNPEKFDFAMARDMFLNTQSETTLARVYLPPTIEDMMECEDETIPDYSTMIKDLQSVEPFLSDQVALTIAEVNQRVSKALSEGREPPPYNDVIQKILYLPRNRVTCIFDSEETYRLQKYPKKTNIVADQQSVKKYFTPVKKPPICLFDD